jgi:hypothetical protein
MKKQFLFIAVISSAIFVSCSKEKNETLTTPSEQSPGISVKPIVLDPLSVGLLGRYEFNNTLKDTTKHLADAASTANGVLYITDRKGITNRAIRFNQRYGVNIYDVPSTAQASLSVWVKSEMGPSLNWSVFVMSWKGFTLQQRETVFDCSHWVNGTDFQDVAAFPVDNKWHHMAATWDSTLIKFYVDGVLIGTAPTPAGAGPFDPLDNYLLGYGAGSYWKGSLDDLRFYNRILSSDEVNKLSHL